MIKTYCIFNTLWHSVWKGNIIKKDQDIKNSQVCVFYRHHGDITLSGCGDQDVYF